MKKLLIILFIACLSLFIVLPALAERTRFKARIFTNRNLPSNERNTDPTATDDASKNYRVGDFRVNESNDILWYCADNTNNNAIWIRSGSSPADVISADQEITPGIYFVDTANVSLHLSTPVAGDQWDIYWAVTGASIFSNDAISFSIGGASYGNASGVSLLNNTDVGPSIRITAGSAVSLFAYSQGTWAAILP